MRNSVLDGPMADLPSDQAEDEFEDEFENNRLSIFTEATRVDPRMSDIGNYILGRVSLAEECLSDNEGKNERGGTAGSTPSFRKLLSFVKEQTHLVVPGSVLIALFVAVDLVIPMLAGQALDAIGNSSRLNTIMSAILATKTAAALLQWGGKSLLIGVASERVAASLRHRLFEAIARQEIGLLDAQRTGDLVFRLNNDVVAVQDAVTHAAADCFCGVVKVFLTWAMMLFLSWKLALLTLAVLPVTFCSLRLFMPILSRKEASCQAALSHSASVSQECIANIKLVRSFAAEEHELERYEAVIGDPERSGFSWCRWWPRADGSTLRLCTVRSSTVSLCLAATGFIISISSYGVFIFGMHQVALGVLTLGDLTAFLMLCFSLAFRLTIIASQLPKVTAGLNSSRRIGEFIDQWPAISTDKGGWRPSMCVGHVAFEEVHFAYPSRPEMLIFEGLSFQVPADSMAAFVGSSGAGKSTVLVLLERFYDATSGVVRLDGHDVRDLDTLWIRQRMGFVHQEPVLFAMTLRENLCYGVTAEQVNVRRSLDLSDESIRQVCEEANAWGFIENLPGGLDCCVGERGKDLSGGQRQRLAIARSLIVNPRILLLDEATSALDAESEELVLEALGRAKIGRTVVAVAHRLSTIMNSDRIHVMHLGRLLDAGRHGELMERCETYRELVERQLGGVRQEPAQSVAETPSGNDKALESRSYEDDEAVSF